MKIQLHIERLVLDGLMLGGSECARVSSALQAELTRLLLAQGLSGELLSGTAVARLRGGHFDIGVETKPVHLGQKIARAVSNGIAGPSESRVHKGQSGRNR